MVLVAACREPGDAMSTSQDSGDAIDEPMGLLCPVEAGPQLHATHDPSVTPFECDLFEPPPAPARVQTPVLVGQSERGDVFVLDELDLFGARVFAAQGSGPLALAESSFIELRYTNGVSSRMFMVGDSFIDALVIQGPVIRVEGELANDFGQSEVFVHYDEASPVLGRIDEVLSEGDLLSPVDDCEAVLDELPPREHWLELEYVYQADDGTTLVVAELLDLREDDAQPEYFVFYGSSASIIQREVLSFVREPDGRTEIEFAWSPGSATVVVPASCEASSSGARCPAELRVGAETKELTPHLDDAADRLSSLDVFCQFSITTP